MIDLNRLVGGKGLLSVLMLITANRSIAMETGTNRGSAEPSSAAVQLTGQWDDFE